MSKIATDLLGWKTWGIQSAQHSGLGPSEVRNPQRTTSTPAMGWSGGECTKIDIINKDNIWFACYLIVGKTMRHFMRNECTLDTISIVEHCC